jgi:hypothetical protein
VGVRHHHLPHFLHLGGAHSAQDLDRRAGLQDLAAMTGQEIEVPRVDAAGRPGLFMMLSVE